MAVKSTIESETYKDLAELSRADFEKELSSEGLKMEYVEHYGDQNKFYFELIDDIEDFEYVKIVLYLIENDKVKFFFLKDNYN
jgi:disulfide oxidoreductase YuzD